jgi:multiple sugar transport system substrate-binding protein
MQIAIRMYSCLLYIIVLAVLGPHAGAVGTMANGPTRPISVWTHAAVNTVEFNALNEAAKAFNQSQRAYRVEIFPSSHRKYEERVQNAAGNGTLPCLLEFDGPFLAAFAWPGYLRPIDQFIPRELLNDLLPSIVA